MERGLVVVEVCSVTCVGACAIGSAYAFAGVPVALRSPIIA